MNEFITQAARDRIELFLSRSGALGLYFTLDRGIQVEFLDENNPLSGVILSTTPRVCTNVRTLNIMSGGQQQIDYSSKNDELIIRLA